MPKISITVEPQDEDTRLDVYLTRLPEIEQAGISRTHIQALLSGSGALVNGKAVTKTNYKLKGGDFVVFEYEEKKAQELNPEDIPLEVLYEDEYLAIIDKPSGLVVHPAPGNPEHTLVNALLNRFGKLSTVSPQRPGIVHRLDKETSGVMVVARTNKAHRGLAVQFADHTIKRRYVALVKGRTEYEENVIEMSIGRHPVKREQMAVGFATNTRYAKTLYRTLMRGPDYSYLELEPFTGRTHQLRVHLAFIGHPILGDVKYGKHNPFSRLALHAKVLGFTHPVTGKYLEFLSPVPGVFTDHIKGNP
jgi:23S rRNA pseudouridine1911/1915/1917 synthase